MNARALFGHAFQVAFGGATVVVARNQMQPVTAPVTQVQAHGPWSLAVDKVVDKLCALVCWDNLMN